MSAAEASASNGGNREPEDSAPTDKGKGRARPKTKSNSASEIPVLRVEEGTGGTFWTGPETWCADGRMGIHLVTPESGPLKGPIRNVEYIGTELCTTGIGLYFEIEKDRCFCAHIKIENKHPDLVDEVPTAIAFRIRHEAHRRRWYPGYVNGRSITVVSMHPEVPKELIEEGINKVFKLNNSSALLNYVPAKVDTTTHGFIRKHSQIEGGHSNAVPKSLAWDPESDSPRETMTSRPTELVVTRSLSHPDLQLEANQWKYVVGKGWRIPKEDFGMELDSKTIRMLMKPTGPTPEPSDKAGTKTWKLGAGATRNLR